MSLLTWMYRQHNSLLGACHSLDVLYVLTQGGRVGRGKERYQGTDRIGQMKGESSREKERDLLPVYRVERTKN